MLHEFWLFVVNVACRYPPLVTGGVIALVIMLYERIRKKVVPRKIFLAVMGSALFLSCFLAWHDEHHNAETLKQDKRELAVSNGALRAQVATKQEEIEHLRDELANRPFAREKAGLKSIREQLGALLSEGDELTKTVCGDPSPTPEQLKACGAAKSKWEQKVEVYLREHLDASFSDRWKHETKHWAGPQLEMGYDTQILSQLISEMK
jgi:cell division protein FtsB